MSTGALCVPLSLRLAHAFCVPLQFAPGDWMLAPLGYATAVYPPTSQAWWPPLIGLDLLSDPSFSSYIDAGLTVSVSE